MTLRLIQPVPLPGIRPEILAAVDDPNSPKWAVVAGRLKEDLPMPHTIEQLRDFVASYAIVRWTWTDQYCLVKDIKDWAYLTIGAARLRVPVLWVSSPRETKEECLTMLELLTENAFSHG